MNITVNFEEQKKVEINGKEYVIKRSDFEVYAIGKEALRRFSEMQPDSVESVRSCIDWMCRQIDVVLGVGAMYQISGGAPVSIEAALKVINSVAAMCGKGYAEYVKNEYIQPVES